MFNRIRVYVGGLAILAILVFGWVYSLNPTPDAAALRAALWFGALSALSGLLGYKKAARKESGSIAFLPMLACVIVAPTWYTITAIGLSVVVVEVASKGP
jgi:hypothetical protein